MTLVSDYLMKKFGADLEYVDKTTKTTAAVSQILKRNPNRFGWVISNLTPFDAFLGFNGQVAVDAGMLIGPAGETILYMWADTHGELVTRELYGISINDCDLFVYEIIGNLR